MRIFRIGVLLVAVLLTGVTVAGFFETWNWVPALAVHFRWQWTAAALVLALAAWVGRARLTLLLALACLGVNGWPLLPYLRLDNPAAATVPAPKLRILSLNLRDDWTDPAAFKALIDAEDPDIILLTELRGDMAPLIAALGEHYPHRLAEPRVSPLDVALYSRWPIEAGRVDRRVGDWLPVLDARVCLPSGCLTIVGVHAALPFGDFKAYQQRQLYLAMDKARLGSNGPVVVMGDLNTTPWSRSFADLIAPDQSFLFDGSRGHGIATTFLSRFPLFGLPIDHVLVANAVVADRRVGPDVGSDHLPLIVDLR